MRDRTTGGADRAQLILVGALALAVTLVGIALVLNSAIFAENLATRSNQGEAGQVDSFEQAASQGGAGSVAYLNTNNSSHSTYGDLEDDFRTTIGAWSGLQIRDRARRGQYVDAEYVEGSMVNGTRVIQDDGGEFTPRESPILDDVVDLVTDSSWALTPQASDIRDFTMTVRRDGIGDGTTVYAEGNVPTFLGKLTTSTSLSADDPRPFTVVYDVTDDGSYNHAVAVYRPADTDGDPNDVKFTYYNTSTGSTTTCEIDDAPATFDVDVSGAAVEGGEGACEAVFDFQSEMADPSQLIFVESEAIEGGYQFIAAGTKGEFRNDYDNNLLDSFGSYDFESYYYPHSDGHGQSYTEASPYVEPAIYSAEIGLNYRSSSVGYNTTVRVAPNEPE